MSGVRLRPLISDLFAFARDDIGWMLVMDEREAPWMTALPFEALFLGYNDGIIVATKSVSINTEIIETVSIDLFVPRLELLGALASESLFGFGLRRTQGAVERVNRLIPIYHKDSFDGVAAQRKATSGRDLFAN